jgi:uncharacterized membrane protein YdbT with pleckstrin-like domain
MDKGFSKTRFLLFPDETIIFITNPHWLLVAAPIAALILFWLIYLAFLCPVLLETGLGEICFILSLFAFPFVIFVLFLDWHFNRLYLTNLRLIKERGIIGKRIMSIFLEQVEDITVSYGIWGGIFKFGDLIIESAGTYGKMVFRGVPRPMQKKYQIENEIVKINFYHWGRI